MVRFVENTCTTLIKTEEQSYILILSNISNSNLYKIPLGSYDFRHTNASTTFVCFDTAYFSIIRSYFNINYGSFAATSIKLLNQRPVYFNRFKYVGKGFKLIHKKKKKFFNCIFGYSHIYLVKLQQVFIKKTKKYNQNIRKNRKKNTCIIRSQKSLYSFT